MGGQPDEGDRTVNDVLCGRPTRRGTPCTSYRAASPFLSGYDSPACKPHMTGAERAEYDDVTAHAKERWAAAAAAVGESTKPDCWSWKVTDEDRRVDGRSGIGRWQAGRCGICGVRDSGMVWDHDHETGWVRGKLCTSCNGLEAASTSRLFDRYRRRNPAAILGMWVRYYHPFYGADWGRLHGRRTWPPLPVGHDGIVRLDVPTLAHDPAHLVAAATTPTVLIA